MDTQRRWWRGGRRELDMSCPVGRVRNKRGRAFGSSMVGERKVHLPRSLALRVEESIPWWMDPR